MAFYVKKDPTRSGSISWPKATGFFVKTDPDRNASIPWKSVKAAFVKVSSTEWKQFWGSAYSISQNVEIALSVDPVTQEYILTGTNYKWTPNTPNPPDNNALIYKFTWYDGTTTTVLTGPTKIANGSISGTDYSPSAVNPIPQSSFSANTSNVYTFYVEAPDGTTSTAAVAIQGPTDITLTAGAVTSTTIDLSWTTSSGAIAYLVYQSISGSSYSIVEETTSTSTTITGLDPSVEYSFYVTPITGFDSINPGYYGNDSNTVTATTTTENALTPTFGTNTATSDGYTGSVTNYSTLFTWGISASDGTVTWGTASGSVRPFTVSGLGMNTASTVTVTTSRTGYENGSATTTFMSAAGTGLVSTFSAITKTANGFTGSVTNYNSNFTYNTPNTEDGSLTGGYWAWGTPSGSNYPFTVTGLNPADSVTAIVTTTRTNYDPGTATITGSALVGNARTPTFGPVTSTLTGFTSYVSNYDANWTWSLNGIERGTFTWGTPSGTQYPFTVSGLTANQSSLLGIRSTRSGYTDGLASIQGFAATSITYNGNNNTGGSTASTVGTLPLTVASNGFTRTGYSFRSWNTAANGTDTVYQPGSSYNIAQNLTLYAIWDIITYTVTWDANGGSVSPASNTVNAGSSVTAPTPSRAGYSFKGWYLGTSGGSSVVSGGGSYTPSSSITLYAQWTLLAPSAPTLSVTNAYTATSAGNNLVRVTSSQKRQTWTYTVKVDYNLSWNAGPAVDTYEVGVSTTTSAPASATYTGLTGTTMNDYWYQSDRGTVTYYYFVRAKNAAGTSSWSSAAGGTSTATVVTGLGIVLVNASNTNLTASASPGNTALTYLWTGVNTAANHFSYLNATIAGTTYTNVRGPTSGSV